MAGNEKGLHTEQEENSNIPARNMFIKKPQFNKEEEKRKWKVNLKNSVFVSNINDEPKLVLNDKNIITINF